MAESALSDRQRLDLGRKLQARRVALREEIRRELLRTENETYGELAGRVHDEGDASVADLLADINIAIISNQVRELRGIEEALQRMHSGAYGTCKDCIGPIEPERLAAHPSATRCYTCQTRHEKTHAGEPRPTL
jgi:DnaK suppressor protein